MFRHFVRPLDRYVFGEFWKIFFGTALGFPILVVIIDLTDHLDKYLSRQIPRGDILLSYVYFLPESAFQVVPAAVLFATVFSIGSLTRHAEITAAKASGISFYRLTAPILLGAFLAALLDVTIAQHQQAGRMLTAQHRDFTKMTDEDVESWLQQFGALGLLDAKPEPNE